MKHLPSVEALTNVDDRRLLAELEICQVLEKLARVRALVDRADDLLTSVLADVDRERDSEVATDASDDERQCMFVDERLWLLLLATIRKASTK